MTTLIGFAIHKSIGMRVSEADELSGIDVTEHAETAYELLMVGGSFHPGDPHARLMRPRPTPACRRRPTQAEVPAGTKAEAEGEAVRGRVSS